MNEECRTIKPELQRYFERTISPDQYIEKHNEILDYMEETFVPNVEKILSEMINLYDVTIKRKSCVIGMDDKRVQLFVNDTFMKEYIYKFIGFWRTISEYCKIMNEFVDEICKPIVDSKRDLYRTSVDRIFCIGLFSDDGFVMCSHIEGYMFRVGIYIDEKYRKSIRPIISSLYYELYSL